MHTDFNNCMKWSEFFTKEQIIKKGGLTNMHRFLLIKDVSERTFHSNMIVYKILVLC
jgi:hypothetical protein